MSYTMQPDVQDAIAYIMKTYGINTVHKAINFCILEYLSTRSALDTEQAESTKLFHERNKLRDVMENFIQCISEMDKHTKTS